MNFEEDVRIDETALDVEALNQPELMAKYVRIQAEARKERDLSKDHLAIVRAELDKKIRKNPDKFGLDKVTNDTVLAAINTHKKYIAASKEAIEAEYEYQMASGGVNSVEMKKSAIEALIKLLGMHYYAGPEIPRDLVSEVEKRKNKDQKANKNVKIKRKN